MTVTFDFDVPTTGYFFQFLSINGMDFNGINGNTSFPQVYRLGGPLTLTLDRANSGNDSGLVTLELRTLAPDGSPCGPTITTRFTFAPR